MNVLSFVKGRCRDVRMRMEQRRVLRTGAAPDIQRSHWDRSLTDPNGFYLDCFRYFHFALPELLRDHRKYFSRRRRGFGEDAFHTMWFLLFREFRPQSFLEIGVYRGQTLSLVALLARMHSMSCDIQGISPFSSAGDSVSRYVPSVDYYRDTLRNFDVFGLPHPRLVKAFSTEPAARTLIASRRWDTIYIDGNHDYEVARADWQICSQNVRCGGLIVLDDSGITSDYRPPGFATRGHLGPSRVAQEISSADFKQILQVGHNRVFQRLGGE